MPRIWRPRSRPPNARPGAAQFPGRGPGFVHPIRPEPAIPAPRPLRPAGLGAGGADGVEDVGEHRLGEEVVEVHPHPAGLDPLAAAADLPLELAAPLELTWSCYRSEDIACGKCDSCALRLRGFELAGVADPIQSR